MGQRPSFSHLTGYPEAVASAQDFAPYGCTDVPLGRPLREQRLIRPARGCSPPAVGCLSCLSIIFFTASAVILFCSGISSSHVAFVSMLLLLPSTVVANQGPSAGPGWLGLPGVSWCAGSA